MMYSSFEPAKKQGNINEARAFNKNIDSSINQCEDYLEKYGPHKKHFKVLHEDGSLADLPDQNVEGGGALEGSIGR
ncbi:hypothetical protein [Mucilaginibacter pocheonensis]|uniref:Uncharacterized protein n=1 Tax=Mucilaginibacter pocheonensis TaxID=398050 RepID=A0ABU1TDP6_9SPHI|nr:hypothetical protein [Mucilaginibacter pocheonensis]MDR6943310.1 hypothetical protein [Mucilaginibacter pocheonensis]